MMANELEECKLKLSQVVDEVLYLESEVCNRNRESVFLKQSLADSTAAHGFVIKALDQLCTVIKRNGSNSKYVQKAEMGAEVAMNDLRRYQLELQKALVESKVRLPPTSLVTPSIPLHLSEFPQVTEKEEKKIVDDEHSKAEELAALFELERKEWAQSAEKYRSQIKDLEFRLERANASQVWPFKDDHLSQVDGFGMSSNSNVARQIEKQQQQQQPQDKNAAQVARLQRLLSEKDKEQKKQQKKLMKQAESELRDAETRIVQLETELKASKVMLDGLNVGGVRIHESGDVDFIDARESSGSSNRELCAIKNTESGAAISKSLHKATLKRLAELEETIAMERREKDKIRRQVEAALGEKRKAVELLEELELAHGIGKEEYVSEQSQRHVLQLELEKAARDREVISREYRAAERRHQALMDEMRQVLEERDQALANAETSNRKYLNSLQELEKAKGDMRTALHEKENALNDKEKAEKQAQHAVRNLDIEKRNYRSVSQDIAILKQQKDALAMERDSAVREQHHAMKRVDDAMHDRKVALEARDRATVSLKALEQEVTQLRISENRERQTVADMKDQVRDLEERLQLSNRDVSKAERELADAEMLVTRANEERTNALQDMELAQRQCKALGEELKSVLRVRDIALQQRDGALAQVQAIQDESLPSLPVESNDSQVESLRDQINALEVNTAALEEEKQALVEQLHHSFGDDRSSTSNAISQAEKRKLVDISQEICELHYGLKASHRQIERPGNFGETTVPTASTSQTIGEIVHTLSSQVNGLDTRFKCYSRDVVKLAERAKQFRSSTEMLQLPEKRLKEVELELEVVQVKARRAQAQLEASRSESESLQLKLEETSALLGQANERVKTLQTHSSQNDSTGAVHVECEHTRDLLRSEIKQLESQVVTQKRISEAEEAKLHQQIREERTQLVEALERLRLSDENVSLLKRKHEENLREIQKLESIREKLSSYVEQASYQLKGVANQKTQAASELQEVYVSLTDLENQLFEAHAENTRLKRIIGSGGSQIQKQGSARVKTEDIQGRSVRIKRTGSIVID